MKKLDWFGSVSVRLPSITCIAKERRDRVNDCFGMKKRLLSCQRLALRAASLASLQSYWPIDFIRKNCLWQALI